MTPDRRRLNARADADEEVRGELADEAHDAEEARRRGIPVWSELELGWSLLEPAGTRRYSTRCLRDWISMGLPEQGTVRWVPS
mgnify:CR=1 FL=1